ncbi:MAG: hypothetical protein QXF15_01720 [Candidatus Aenigmatarchaeota archaeon]
MVEITALERLGLPDMIIWLLTFSIVYGLLSHSEIPKSKAARAIISLVLAFFVMFSAPATMVTVLSKMGSALILTVLGILVFIVFLEAIGMRKRVVIIERDKEGKEIPKPVEVNIFQYYSKYFLAIFVIIAIIIFLASGGFNLLGWNINLNMFQQTGIFFIIAIIIAILWLVLEKGD